MAPLLTWAALSLAVVAVHGSVSIPKDHPNGIYAFTYDKDGKAVHTKTGDIKHNRDLDVLELNSTQPKMRIEERGDWDSNLGCSPEGEIIDVASLNQAISNLGSSCDCAGTDFVKAYSGGKPHGVYANFNGAIAYVCNFEPWSQRCLSSEANIAITNVMHNCNNVGGWSMGPWKKSYGSAAGNVPFC